MKQSLPSHRMDKSIFLLQPTRPIFCTTKNQDGTDHAAPFSWLMPISCAPPKVAFALQNQRGKKLSQSLVNIMREGEFGVNMPHMGQEHTLVQSSYGLVHHRCKFDRTGYTRQTPDRVRAALMQECAASLECKVFSVQDCGGDHTLILADVVAASYDPDCYDENLCPDVSILQPLINLKEDRFDDRQEHVFLRTDGQYRVAVPYEKQGGE